MIKRILGISYQQKVKQISNQAESYEEWMDLAREYDYGSEWHNWIHEEESDLYDNVEIRDRLNKLRSYRQSNDHAGLLFTLNEGIHGNMAGIGNPKLYTKALSGTKSLIVDYVNEVADSIVHISKVPHDEISFEDKLDFLHRASHCFGRTALMLSGGGQLGHFHVGVLKALIENDLLPRVISGSSVGSIFTALVGSLSRIELRKYFDPEELIIDIDEKKGLLAKLINRRGTISIEDLQQTVESHLPNLTFLEAFEKTGMFINISVAPRESLQKSRLLNAIASPNVLIRSAVMASCAIPGIFPPVTLRAKNKEGEEVNYLPSRKWVDGSMTNDLPSKRLSRLYGVNHFIVSLTNPVVLPFATDTSTNNEWISAARKLGSAMIKETTQFNYSIAKPFFKYIPKLAETANGINSIVQQYYHGDINIIADFSVIKPRHLLSSLTHDEVEALIRNGEKATWPKLNQIKISTCIATVLDDILREYERIEIELAKHSLEK